MRKRSEIKRDKDRCKEREQEIQNEKEAKTDTWRLEDRAGVLRANRQRYRNKDIEMVK